MLGEQWLLILEGDRGEAFPGPAAAAAPQGPLPTRASHNPSSRGGGSPGGFSRGRADARGTVPGVRAGQQQQQEGTKAERDGDEGGPQHQPLLPWQRSWEETGSVPQEKGLGAGGGQQGSLGADAPSLCSTSAFGGRAASSRMAFSPGQGVLSPQSASAEAGCDQAQGKGAGACATHA